MRLSAAMMAAAFLGTLLPVHAQERKPGGPAVYKVEFDIRESSDGEAQPSQHFSMLIHESRTGFFQAANRIPVATSSPQYVNVGVNIECAVHESNGKAALRGGIELASILGHVNLSAISQPIIGQRKMSFDTTVELGTPTVIIDDRHGLAANPISLNRTDAPVSGIPAKPVAAATRQVEATVTKVN